MGVGPSPLRRLAEDEIVHSLSDLLGARETDLALGLADEILGRGGFLEPAPVSETELERLLDAADRVAQQVSQQADAIAPCAPSEAESSCARAFIERFGRRLFRRPLHATEQQRLETLYDEGRSTLALSRSEAIAHVVSAMMLAPQFLYRSAPGGGAREDDLVPLDPHERAARLSYFLWRSTPDDALLADADRGVLRPEDLARHAQRMLLDPRATRTLTDFHRQLLRLARAGTSTSGADQGLDTFVDDVVRRDGRLPTLLTAPIAFVDNQTASIYGVASPTSASLTRIELDPSRRAGLLTQVAFLTRHGDGTQSHPVKRGAVIFERLLCGELPAQPAEVPQPRPAAQNLSNRDRFAEHAENACARGCHQLIDGWGFALEAYDGRGAYRTTDGGKAVDASGRLVFPGGRTAAVVGAGELTATLAASPEVQDCFVRQWVRYLLGRHELEGEQPILDGVRRGFVEHEQDIRELLVAITRSELFTHRGGSKEDRP